MSVCECGACGRVFGTLELFDAHQQWDRTGVWTLTCVLPPGLVRDGRGTWRTPEGLAAYEAVTARLAASRPGAGAVSRFQGQDVPGPTPGPSGATEATRDAL